MSHGDALPRPPLHSWLFYVFDGIFLSGRVGLEREPSALWWRYAPHSFLPPKKWKRRERFEKNGREWRWNECVKANGGREKTECASITGSKDYSCHFQWILVSHSLFSSYIFFPSSFFYLPWVYIFDYIIHGFVEYTSFPEIFWYMGDRSLHYIPYCIFGDLGRYMKWIW